jgi:hypothetical protein
LIKRQSPPVLVGFKLFLHLNLLIVIGLDVLLFTWMSYDFP